MPASFERTTKIVKRFGGDPAILDTYEFDCEELPHVMSSEMKNADPNEIVVKLFLDQSMTFVDAAPILTDEPAKRNYLFETSLTQGVNVGKFYRCRIKNAVKILDDRHGEMLQITGEGVEIRLKESPLSHPQRLKTPQYAITKWILDYNQEVASVPNSDKEQLFGNGTITNGKVVTGPETTVLLDDSHSLKQNWTPGSVKNYYDGFDLLIQRQSLSQGQGGLNIEYYIDYLYPNTVGHSDKQFIQVIAKEFGLDDSGVTVDPISTVLPELEDTEIIDNTKYYDSVVLECDAISGTLPVIRGIYFSDLEHARLRDDYDGSTTYALDDQVKVVDNAARTIRFYKSLTDSNTGNTPPTAGSPASSGFWEEDFIQDNRYSPLTNNLEIWRANMAAHGFSEISADYEGFFVDPNFVRANFDRGDLDHYQYVTMKDVTRIATSNANIPTLAEEHDGKRFLVGQDSSVAITTEPFASNKAKIAEYDESVDAWRFSKAPEADEVIYDVATSKLYKYVGTYPSGDWQVLWDINVGAAWQTSPAHPVKSVSLKPDIHGNANAAVEFLFDWNTDILTGGDSRNRYSRGYWLNFWNPVPRFDMGAGYAIGEICKQPFLDTENLTYSQQGILGYNGKHGEDKGPIQGITFVLTASIEDAADKLLDFKANQNVTFWIIDKFLRVHFIDDVIPANGKPARFTMGFGLDQTGEPNLWVNRVDDLEEIFGLTIPAFFGLKQEENAGVTFDWNFVYGWGILSADSYNDEPKFYAAGRDSYRDDLAGRLQVAWEYFINSTQSLFEASEAGPAIVLADHAKLRIEDLFYVKQLVVSSIDTPLTNPHTKVFQDHTETDYRNAELTAKSLAAKGKAFRPVKHITADLDVRLQKGMRFKVADGTEYVAIEVNQITNDDGALMEISAIPKLVIGI